MARRSTSHTQGGFTSLVAPALAALALILAAPPAAATGHLTGNPATYTLDMDFVLGDLIKVNHDIPFHDQLQLNPEGEACNFIWVAASGRGTIVKIDTETGEVLGEYWSSPSGRGRNPSRTTVDANGNVWAGNRDESSGGQGSVIHIGLVENGQCVDRNGNGVIDTSTGLGDIRPWTNPGGVDDGGGVSSAEDECILHYVRTAGTYVRTVAVDGANHVWVGGYGNRVHELLDPDGNPVPGTAFNLGCGGYGGLVDGNGMLWSAGASQNYLLRYDPATSTGTCIYLGRFSYGLGIDNDGYIWHSNWTWDTVLKIRPDGAIMGTYATYGNYGDRGVVVTPVDNDVWVANSYGDSVSRLAHDGTYKTVVAAGAHPTGVAVDAAGKVWVTNYSSHNVMRIDPATDLVDLTVSLGPGAYPYNYSDMTGSTVTAPPDNGTWRVVHDSGIPGAVWGLVTWNGDEPSDSSLVVTAASSDDGVTFSPPVTVTPGFDLALPDGQFLEVTVSFTRASTGESPVLYDLTIAAGVECAWDLKFCSMPNAFNCKRSRGVVPLTLFGSEDLDVGEVDLSTLRLALAANPAVSTGPPVTGGTYADRGSPLDVETALCVDDVATPDGWLDLDVGFPAAEVGALIGCDGLAKGDLSPDLVLTGALYDGRVLLATGYQVATNVSK